MKQYLETGSRGFLLFLLYLLFTVFTEWILFLLWAAGIPCPAGVAEGASLALAGGLCFCLRGRVRPAGIRPDGWRIAGLALVALAGILISVYPDDAFDTLNYHLIAQAPRFEDYFTGNYYAYGNFQVWGFRLADRLFYPFRLLLGYRFGTLLNTLVLMLSFLQLAGLLEHLAERFLRRKPAKGWTAAWALVLLFPLDTMMMLGSYYVDMIALPAALEILRFLLSVREREFTVLETAYFSLLSGLMIALKLTNLVYAVPCILVYLWFRGKQAGVRHWLAAAGCFVFPFAVYLLFNAVCTGNPVFPYFNRVFRSPRFAAENWQDDRWGGQTLPEKLFWLLYAVFRPDYRQGEIPDLFPSPVLILGMAGFGALLFSAFRRREQRETVLPLFFLAAVSALLWGLTTGISRYYIFGKILWGLPAFLLAMAFRPGKRAALRAVSWACTAVCLAGMGWHFRASLLQERNWKWAAFRFDTFGEEFAKVLKDNDLTAGDRADADAFLLTDLTGMGVSELVQRGAKKINLRYEWLPALGAGQIREMLDGAGNLADIHARDFHEIEAYLRRLNRDGLRLRGMQPLDAGAGDYLLVRVDLAENPENRAWIFGGPLELRAGGLEPGKYRLRWTDGRMYSWPGSRKVALKAEALQADGTWKEKASAEVDNRLFINRELEIRIREGEEALRVRAVYTKNGKDIPEKENNPLLLNWELEKAGGTGETEGAPDAENSGSDSLL